jgi:hypothetical protein
MELLGVFAGPQGVADNGILLHSREATRLANATALVQVGQDIEDLGIGESRIEQGRALALGEALLTGTASEHAPLGAAIAEGDPEIALPAPAVVGAVSILTAEAAQIVRHRWHREKAFRGT